MSEEVTSILPSIELHKFPKIQTNLSGEKTRRTAFVMCPICYALDDFYNCHKTRKFESYYCPGSQPPTYDVRDITGHSHTHTVPCAGVSESHIHTKCNCCETVFLISTPTPEAMNG